MTMPTDIETTKDLLEMKKHKSIFKNVIIEKFRKQFYFLTCILPDYVGHESSKFFRKNSHFENMRADFLRICQNSLQTLALK